MVSYLIQPRTNESGQAYVYVHATYEDGEEEVFTIDSDGWELVVSAVIDSRGGGFDG